MLPFFIYAQPETARALLLYRFHTLDGARRNARDGGLRGARYAWESADTGVETTPKWTVDGAHRLWMGEEEIHVTATVAYGLMAYVAATGDNALMTDYGAEILFETSRFWADRLEAMPDGRYELSRVVGPDEFHEHVDNSAYSNYLVRWHLQQAAHVYAGLAVTRPGELASLSERIGLTPDEVEEWLSKAEQIRLPAQNDDGVIERSACCGHDLDSLAPDAAGRAWTVTLPHAEPSWPRPYTITTSKRHVQHVGGPPA